MTYAVTMINKAYGKCLLGASPPLLSYQMLSIAFRKNSPYTASINKQLTNLVSSHYKRILEGESASVETAVGAGRTFKLTVLESI